VKKTDFLPLAAPFIDAWYPSLENLYTELHANPELSGQEKLTAAKLAGELEKAGCTVTRNVGGHGVVGILLNGDGPMVMLRADMDALPIVEETGLPYQSSARAVDSDGREVGVMHACGHDLHMASLVGAARVFSSLKSRWSGTLMFIGQPSEETVSGSARMLADGLYTRFGRPDAAISFHLAPDLPEGVIGYREGIFSAGGESLDVTVHGIGGHAAHPEQGRDPVVAAAIIILAFQTIVSRECPPDDFAVITVASVHGGFKHNTIPDEVKLQVNIRYFDQKIRDLLLNALKRTAEGIALSAGIPRSLMPSLVLLPESVPPLINDSDLTGTVATAFIRSFGEARVWRVKPMTGSEDFGLFGFGDLAVPLFYFRVGCGNQGGSCGYLHSSRFAPDPGIIKVAVSAIVVGAMELLGSGL
jgi:amidohydrolase